MYVSLLSRTTKKMRCTDFLPSVGSLQDLGALSLQVHNDRCDVVSAAARVTLAHNSLGAVLDVFDSRFDELNGVAWLWMAQEKKKRETRRE